MNTTLVVGNGNVNSQIEEITSWLDEHLAHGQHDSDFLTIELVPTNTTYQIRNTLEVIEMFKKRIRLLDYARARRVSNKYPDVRRLRPQGVKYWEKEIAALQNPKPKSDYAKLTDWDRAILADMAQNNIKILKQKG